MSSQKITGKNLSYSQNLPPFLARLHGHGRAGGDGPDPILAGRRRAVKPRDDSEDAPVVLDEHGNVVDDVHIGVDGSAVRTASDVGTEGAAEGEEDDAGERLAGGGGDGGKKEVGPIGARKRKAAAGKVIGGGGEDDDGEDETSGNKVGKGNKRNAVVTKQDLDEEAPGSVVPKSTGDGKPSGSSKGKKKSKKIKLSFGDDGE